MSQARTAAPLPDVPGFAVERRLGAGASCEVWLAREREGLRRVVALKLYRADASGLEARERELEAVRRVETLRRAHPDAALLRSLATGEAPGVAWLAFEAHEEGTLEDRVTRGGPLPFGAAVDCARQVLAALALLHEEGLYHRDVKPSNLLIGRDGRVLVADFGLSRPLAGTLSSAGSPAFAAPEAIAGRPHDGRKLDVYSVGATLAWLLTGETMLPGRPDVFLLERHGVPRPLQRVIVRAMALDPRERTPTVEALLEELAAASLAPQPAPEPAPEPEPLPTLAPAPAGVDPAELEQRRRSAWTLVERCGYASAAATALPIPGSEWLAVLPLHVGLVVGVGELYGCALDETSAADLVKRLGAVVGLAYLGGRAITTVAKFVLPGAGGLAGAVLTFGATLGLGAVVIAFFEREGALDEGEIRALYSEALTGARERFDPARVLRRESPPQDPALVERLARLDRLLEGGLISPEEHAETTRRIHET